MPRGANLAGLDELTHVTHRRDEAISECGHVTDAARLLRAALDGNAALRSDRDFMAHLAFAERAAR